MLPDPALRERMLELALAPRLPLDLHSYEWSEVQPGVRLHAVREDPSRGILAVLVWGKPGARCPPHRHVGDEDCLILQGSFREPRGVFRAGQVCRSRAGSVHWVEILPGEDCICYIVHYGGLEEVPGPTA